MNLKQLAERIHGTLILPEGVSHLDQLEISGVAPIAKASPKDVTFLASSSFEKHLETTEAGAIIVNAAYSQVKKPQITHKNPALAFALASQIFNPPKKESQTISKDAFIASDAKLGEGVTVYPLAYVGPKAIVGNGAVIYPGTYVGEEAAIGHETIVHANVVVGDRCKVGSRVTIHGGSVIGADGFGFVPGEVNPGKMEIVKIPQVGIVVIEDDVEIGSGSTIDRATHGETRIRRGTKIDSSVHVAHNVEIGQNCFLCGHVGVAGSVKIGNWVVLAGHSGVADHVEICDGVQVGGMGGVTKSITEAGAYMGFPAIPAKEWKRLQAYLHNLPKLDEKIKNLEEKLNVAIQDHSPEHRM